MPNTIDTIQLSGTSYNLKDTSATTVVEITQNNYDQLPSSAKTENILYIITDAAGGDLSNYYTKTEIDAMIGNIESLLAAI
jgi:hypothetical protein